MPAPAWLQVSGISLSTDTAHAELSTIVSEEQITEENGSTNGHSLDGQGNHRTTQKFEHTDLAKKLFLDRQIKKAKSLPGLIK